MRVESSARESGRGGESGRSRASGSAEESGDFYRTSLRLRAARSEILRIRGKLQTFAHCKYPNLRKLMQQFDLDRNGEISLSDWLGGLKEHNFPVTEPEARLLFAGLDEDGSNGLSYSELVWLFQPASLASLPPPADPRKKQYVLLLLRIAVSHVGWKSMAKAVRSDGDLSLVLVLPFSLPFARPLPHRRFPPRPV